MKKSKNKALVVLVIALVVVLLASFAAQAFNTSGYSVSVSRIYFDTEHGTLSGLLYMPKGVSRIQPRTHAGDHSRLPQQRRDAGRQRH